MIIYYPTGSFDAVLPEKPEDSASVVYTISNNAPPRSRLNFIQIPAGIQNKQRASRYVEPVTRRANLGVLALVAKDNRAGSVVAGNQLFYFGQVIDAPDPSAAVVEDVNAGIETQHDQIYIDPGHIGLNDNELSDISAEALDAQGQVLIELEALQKSKDDLRVEIVSQQKVLNDATRVIDALAIIIDLDPGNLEMQALKLQTEIVAAEAATAIDEAVAELSTLPDLIRTKHTRLRTLATLID